MDLRRLRTFVTVAELGTVSGAADTLRITQPALSRQLQDLKAEFGVALFEPVGRRLRLTAEGAELLPACRALLGEADRLLEHARSLSLGDSGELRVGATPHTIANVFPRFLRRFGASFPKVQVRTVEAGGIDQWDMLRRGELHAAVSLLEGNEDGFVAHPLPPLRHLVVGSRRSASSLPEKVEVRELAGQKLLLLRGGYGTRRIFDAACRLERLVPSIVLESASTDTLLALAREGHGLAVIPSTAPVALRSLRVLPLWFRGRPLGGEIAVLWNGERQLPRYSATFSAMLRQELAAAMERWLD